MANVLPEQLKKNNQKEYLFRFIIITEVLLSSVFVFSTILVLPSYRASLVEEKNKNTQITQIREYNVTRREDFREEAINKTRASLDVLSRRPRGVVTSDIVENILRVVDDTGGIVFNGVFYEDTQKNGSIRKIIISGVSDTRAKLLLFTKNLENTEKFNDVILPVSNLTEGKDLTFSVVANIK